MKGTQLRFEAGEVVARPVVSSATVVVEVTDDDLTGVAGVALWGPLMDRLNVVGVADERRLRVIGPTGYSGGECYRSIVELLLAGGDFLSDRSLLAGPTQELRGAHRLPSHPTLFRFANAAEFGTVNKAAAVNRTMLARAWAMGAGPPGGVVTIDPDATLVFTYGPGKQASRFTYKGEVGLSPLLGVCGETGDVLAVRARGGNATPGRSIAGFIRECVTAVPAPVRSRSNLWIRIDSAGYQHEAFHVCDQLGAAFSVTAPKHPNICRAIDGLATDPDTVWVAAAGHEETAGSQIAETQITIGSTRKDRRVVRLIVRRQPTSRGEQLDLLSDRAGWRYHAIVTNLPAVFAPAVDVEGHHRRRGGIPEDTIRQLKEDFGLNHAPLQNFFGNWLWWQACALAHNIARWIRCLALPASFARCRGKRLRLAFFNVAARITRHARTTRLRLPRHHPWADQFIEAVHRLRALPAFA